MSDHPLMTLTAVCDPTHITRPTDFFQTLTIHARTNSALTIAYDQD